MNRKLTDEEMKNVANFIAQRYATTVSCGEINRSTEYYLEAYNKAMDKLEQYNKSITK